MHGNLIGCRRLLSGGTLLLAATAAAQGPGDGELTLIAPHCDLQLADAGGDVNKVPKVQWIQVATEGEYRGHHQGAFTLTRDVFESFVHNFHADPRYTPGQVEVDGKLQTLGSKPVIRFDFEHASEQPPTTGMIPVTGVPAPAWALELAIRNGPKGAELWALAQLGDRIRGYIANNEYRQTSIAFTLNGLDYRTRERIGPLLTSIAFTNDPFLKHLESFAASRRAGTAETGGLQQTQSGEGATGFAGDPMNPDAEKFRAAVCKAANIRTLATDEEVVNAIEAQAAAGAGQNKLLEALGVGDLDAAKNSIAALQAAMVELEKARQEIASILEANAAADATVAEGDVAAVMSANGWTSDTLKPALLARRAQIVADHQAAARKREGVTTLSAGSVVLVTEEARQAFLAEHGVKPATTNGGVDTRLLTSTLVASRGGRVQLQPPASGGQPRQLGARPGAPLPVEERGSSNGLDLRALSGRNPTERIISHLRQTENGFSNLDWQTQVGRAVTFRQQNPDVLA